MGQHAGGFDELDVVQGIQRLERGVGALAFDGAVFPGRGIEVVHAGRGRGPFPEGIHAAAVKPFAFIGLVKTRVALGHGHGIPEAVGLIGPDAGAADFMDEQTGGAQGVVAHHLGIHAEARAAGEQLVGGVLDRQFRAEVSLLAVGRGGDDETEEFLHIPAFFPELH